MIVLVSWWCLGLEPAVELFLVDPSPKKPIGLEHRKRAEARSVLQLHAERCQISSSSSDVHLSTLSFRMDELEAQREGSIMRQFIFCTSFLNA